MKFTETALPGTFIIEPRVFEDDRGFFMESYSQSLFEEKTGIQSKFVQDNHSHSTRNVLRGLHYQVPIAQGKLIRVVAGEIYDVAVDIRRNSKHFGKWIGAVLSAENKKMLWMPEGFAHGFVVLSDSADVLYKTTAPYDSRGQRCIRWDDPQLGIKWPIQDVPILSANDAAGQSFDYAEHYSW